MVRSGSRAICGSGWRRRVDDAVCPGGEGLWGGIGERKGSQQGENSPQIRYSPRSSSGLDRPHARLQMAPPDPSLVDGQMQSGWILRWRRSLLLTLLALPPHVDTGQQVDPQQGGPRSPKGWLLHLPYPMAIICPRATCSATRYQEMARAKTKFQFDINFSRVLSPQPWTTLRDCVTICADLLDQHHHATHHACAVGPIRSQ